MNKTKYVWYEKTYLKTEAVDYHRSKNRYELLKRNIRNIYPKIKLYECDAYWRVSQQYLKSYHKEISFSRLQLKSLAKKLDKNMSKGLWHGDLCFSNIGFDERQNILLYDWEINLECLENGRYNLRTTPYCLHPVDEKNNCISDLSDKFGFAALAIISCHDYSWRSCLSFMPGIKLKVADFINNISDFSYVKLVDEIIYNFDNTNLFKG
tara:strand:+ start:933 stop:1559 length:627 start_codon:yes stop_codon:yes gene_type:complete